MGGSGSLGLAGVAVRVGKLAMAAVSGWRVAVYKLTDMDRWQGPVVRQKAKDETEAEAISAEIAAAIEEGSWAR